jgi:5-methylcytosine-specific restriction protein A
MPVQQCKNKPCCANLVVRGFCPACLARGLGKDIRPSAAERGYGARWQRESKAYLAAHPVAVDWFGEHGSVVYAAEVVDHIVPHRGDMILFWDRGNWQGLTKADHDKKTASEDGGFGRASKAIRK